MYKKIAKPFQKTGPDAGWGDVPGPVPDPGLARRQRHGLRPHDQVRRAQVRLRLREPIQHIRVLRDV